MKRLFIAVVLMAAFGCKKPEPKTEAKTPEAPVASPAVPAPHLDPRNAASTLATAHRAADKLESAEDKQNEELKKLDQ